MSKLYSIVAISLILVLSVFGCEPTPEPAPSMNAAQVIEHVNQVMENEYEYGNPSLRIQTSYKALSAKNGEYGYWHITVERKAELQRLNEDQWTPYPGSPTEKDIIYKYFEEATGQLTPTAVAP